MLGERQSRLLVDLDRDGRAAAERAHGRLESSRVEDPRVDTARDLAQLVQLAGGFGGEVAEIGGEFGEFRWHLRLCRAQP